MNPSLSEMVTDGANRVGERRDATPEAVVCFASAVVLTIVMLRARRAHVLVSGGVAVVVSAVPGLLTIAERRADSPAKAMGAAAVIERFQGEIETFADTHGCARILSDTCVACDPIVDFALATSRACRTPAPIMLGPDALTEGCIDARGTLTCGASGP
jgi:hypothetical protein